MMKEFLAFSKWLIVYLINFLVLLFFTSLSFTQTAYIENISPSDQSEYGFSVGPRNWAFIKGVDSIMFVGNTNGILSFDGNIWRKVQGSDNINGSRFGKTASGNIYGGIGNRLGVLKPDSTGNMRFFEMDLALADSVSNSFNIQSIRTIQNKVYFIDELSVLEWDEISRNVKKWTLNDTIQEAEVVNNELFLWLQSEGLFSLRNQGFEYTGLPKPNQNLGIRAVLFQKENSSWLLFSKEKGVWLLNEQELKPVFPHLLDSFPQLVIWDALPLNQTQYAIATDANGILIIDDFGRLKEIVNQSSGLQTNSVLAFGLAQDGYFWAGLDIGISLIQYPAILKNVNESQGLSGIVLAFERFKGRLYLGTSTQLYVSSTREPQNNPSYFQPLNLKTEEVWDLLSYEGELFIAGTQGLFVFDGQTYATIVGQETCFKLHPSAVFPDLIWVGLDKGVGYIEKKNGTWLWGGILRTVNHDVRTLAEDEKGRLWAGNRVLSCLQLGPEPGKSNLLHQFSAEKGLPGGIVELVYWEGRLRIGTDKGLWLFDEEKLSPVPDSMFINTFPEKVPGTYSLAPDQQGRLWLTTGSQNGYLHPVDPEDSRRYRWESRDLRPIQTTIWSIFPDPTGPVYLGAAQEFFAYDPAREYDYSQQYQSLIREVKINGDSIVFRGHWADQNEHPLLEQPLSAQPVFPASVRELDFQFTLPAYSHREDHLFRYRLKGYETEWSDWKQVHEKSYTNLKEGTYTFEVQGKTLFDQLGQPATYHFSILPPWYRTWWAFLLYLLLLGGLIALFLNQQLKRQRRILQKKEMELAREKEAAEKLRRIDQLRDEFLANTSHELRTPLHGMMGLAESIRDHLTDQPPQDTRHTLNQILASGKRLSMLVDDILDFSKLKSYEIELSPRSLDLQSLVEVVLHVNRTLTQGKDLQILNRIDEEFPAVWADENRLQQILHNLIGNAIKFTPQGEILLEASLTPPQEGPRMARVSVTDTGIGIAPEKQELIFQEFQQADGSVAREFGGTGLGLSISRQLVELHGGTIGLESQPGQGSCFFFTLPLSDRTKNKAQSSTLEITPSLEKSSLPPAQPVRLSDPAGHILIVDDEIINQQVLQNHLNGQNYQLSFASNGSEALEMIQNEGPFDLVLLDVMMPRMSGYQVCQEIRKNYLPSELPVIMVTAKNQISGLVEGLGMGSNDYLPKPFSRDELLARIKTHLDLHRIHEQTARFVPHEFLRILGRDSVMDLRLGDGVEKIVTVAFTDIRSYTSLADQMSPEETFRFVSSYVGRMGPIIKSHHGFVHQYLGDGILSIFQEQAENGLEACVAMQETIKVYNEDRQSMGREPITVGMGLHIGPLIMGVIGDEKRTETASISGTVNIASRMEGMSKFFGAAITLSETVYQQLSKPEKYEFRWLGEVQLKGREDSIGVYECLNGHTDETRELKLQTREVFQKGQAAFMKQDFATAVHCFETVYAQHPADKAARQYLEWATGLLETPPKAGWAGIWKMENK
jgi:signal transduction histidine kinase/class 3 adenylate cyclase/ligand-binding sensor domain-containing protein